jgi:uncharacterized iron-regulated membrane protein
MTQNERRELWTLIHRYLGLAAMLFLGIAAITGCILCFAKPLDRALNADLFYRQGSLRGIAPVDAVERFVTAVPSLRIIEFPLNIDPGSNIPIDVAPAPGAPAIAFDQLFLDGGDGHVVGTRSKAPSWGRRGIVAGIADFHFNLLAGDWGRWLMGVMALAWFVSNLVGVYLTWPRKRPWLGNWKRMWRFSFRSVFARLMLDIHRSTGLWLLIGVSILAFTSFCLNFYAEAYEPLVVRISPLKRTLFDRPAPYPQGAQPTLRFDRAIAIAAAEARRRKLDWKPATALYLPAWNLYGVTFTNDGTLNYRALGPVNYYVDARSGRIVHEVDPYSDSAGLVMIRMLYPLHSGQVGGPITVAIIFLLGLATTEMCVTGGYVWWKKRQSRVAARAAAARRTAAKAT